MPGEAKAKTYWTALQKSLVAELVRARTTEVMVNADLKAMQRPGETREEFVARCRTLVDTAADKQMTALRTKYESKLITARAKATDAQINAQVAAAGVRRQLRARRHRHLGARQPARRPAQPLVDGRRRAPAVGGQREGRRRGAEGAARGPGRRARSSASSTQEILALDAQWNAKAENITTRTIPLEKADVIVRDFRVVWIPVA